MKHAVSSHTTAYTGDSIYQKWPDDPNGSKPEPDDTRLQEWLDYEKSLYEDDNDTTTDTDVEQYKAWIEKYDRPAHAEENKTFAKIRDFCLKKEYYEDYRNLLSDIIYGETLKNNPEYKAVIYSALEIPADHVLSDEEWDEIADCFE